MATIISTKTPRQLPSGLPDLTDAIVAQRPGADGDVVQYEVQDLLALIGVPRTITRAAWYGAYADDGQLKLGRWSRLTSRPGHTSDVVVLELGSGLIADKLAFEITAPDGENPNGTVIGPQQYDPTTDTLTPLPSGGDGTPAVLIPQTVAGMQALRLAGTIGIGAKYLVADCPGGAVVVTGQRTVGIEPFAARGAVRGTYDITAGAFTPDPIGSIEDLPLIVETPDAPYDLLWPAPLVGRYTIDGAVRLFAAKADQAPPLSLPTGEDSDTLWEEVSPPAAGGEWGAIGPGAGVGAQSDLVAYVTNRLQGLVVGNPANIDSGEQITPLPFYTSMGGIQYLLGFRWQGDDNNPRQELVVSYDSGSTWRTVAELGAGAPFTVFFTTSTAQTQGFSTYEAAAALIAENDVTVGMFTAADLNAPLDEDTGDPLPFSLPNGPLRCRDLGTSGVLLEVRPAGGSIFDLEARRLVLNGGVVKMSATESALPQRLVADRVYGEVRISAGGQRAEVNITELRGFINLLSGTELVFTGHVAPPDGSPVDAAVIIGTGTVYLKNGSAAGKIADTVTIVDLDGRGRSTPIQVDLAEALSGATLDLTTYPFAENIELIGDGYSASSIDNIVGYDLPTPIRLTSQLGLVFFPTRPSTATAGAIMGTGNQISGGLTDTKYHLDADGDFLLIRREYLRLAGSGSYSPAYVVIGENYCG